MKVGEVIRQLAPHWNKEIVMEVHYPGNEWLCFHEPEIGVSSLKDRIIITQGKEVK